MAEKEQVKPLAPAADGLSSDEEEVKWQSPRKLHKRRCIICCGCSTAIFLLLAIVVLVLVLTVFRIKDPIMTMKSVRLDGMNIGSNPSALNMTLTAGVSVKNPNVASFKFGDGMAHVSYKEKIIGEGRIPAGRALARRTLLMNVTVVVIIDQIFGDSDIVKDAISGNVTVNSYTKLGGKVNLLNIFKKRAVVEMNCTITMSVVNQSIVDQKCKESVKL